MLFFVVAAPTVNIRALENQTVGQSLTLECELVITDDFIMRSISIIWSGDGMELQRMNDVSPTAVGSSLVYTDSYSISQLNTADDGRMIQCEANISTTSALYNHSITLDVIGEYYMHIRNYCHLITLRSVYILVLLLFIHSSYTEYYFIAIWSHARSYGG